MSHTYIYICVSHTYICVNIYNQNWKHHGDKNKNTKRNNRCQFQTLGMYQDTQITHKHPVGPETVPIETHIFFLKMVILPQCRANLMIGNPGKTWGAFFRFFSVIAATHA